MPTTPKFRNKESCKCCYFVLTPQFLWAHAPLFLRGHSGGYHEKPGMDSASRGCLEVLRALLPVVATASSCCALSISGIYHTMQRAPQACDRRVLRRVESTGLHRLTPTTLTA